MNTALLDITDSNLQLWRGDTPLRSPGYALLQGKQYTFGNPARAAARLRPREINTRYWWQLNTEPLQPALGPARHSADMVHAHLLDIHEQAGRPEELLLAVSGSMQRNQLALLLGIIQQCPFEAVGLVNRSVALGSLRGATGRLFHLEIQLHQAVITELAQTGDTLELQQTTPLPGCGLLQLQEGLVAIIAAGFIRQTRFDPRRKAESEQRLYDALPDALRSLGSAVETNLEVNGYRARINRGELQEAGQRLFNGVAEAMGSRREGDRVLLDPIAGLLPGLAERLPASELLDNGALVQAVSRHGDRLLQREQALNFITSLPCLEQTAAPISPEPIPEPEPEPIAGPSGEPAGTAPTHLLAGAFARPLQPDGLQLEADCELYREAQQWLLRGEGARESRVNDREYLPGQALYAGDSVVPAGGNSFTLIEVLP